MKKAKHYIIGFAILAVVFAVTRYIVVAHAKPNQLTILQAQSMNMSAMRPPIGAVPVALATVRTGIFQSSVTYTGTVIPYNDEFIYPRVVGQLLDVAVYPGDVVHTGEVLAHLDTSELSSKLNTARQNALMAVHDYEIAKQQVSLANDQQSLAHAKLQAALSKVADRNATVASSQSALSQAKANLRAVEAELPGAKAGIKSAAADLAYWKAEIAREKSLLKHGAVSQQSYDSEHAAYVASESKVTQAEAKETAVTADIQSAQQQVEQASDQLQGAASRLAAAQADAKAAKADVQAANVNFAISLHNVIHKRLGVKMAKSQQQTAAIIRGYTTIRAETNGRVTERLASPGTLVSPGMPILRIAEMGRVRLQANVAELDASHIKVGAPVIAYMMKNPGQLIHAHVTSIFPAASPETRTVVVEALVDNPGGRLLPGDYVVMRITTGSMRHSLSVPTRALMQFDNRWAVWTAEKSSAQSGGSTMSGMDMPGMDMGSSNQSSPQTAADSNPGSLVAHMVYVQVGSSNADQTEILSGLKAGDHVVIAGKQNCQEGAVLFPTQWGASGPQKLPPPPSMGNMPGMNMPGMSMPSAPPGGKAAKPAPSMRGMNMPGMKMPASSPAPTHKQTGNGGMSNMPGMSMPSAPPGGKAAKPAPSMRGMNMPGMKMPASPKAPPHKRTGNGGMSNMPGM